MLSFSRDGMYDGLFHSSPPTKGSDWPEGLACRHGIRLHLQISKVTSPQQSDFSVSASPEDPLANWSEGEGVAATMEAAEWFQTNYHNITNDRRIRRSMIGSRGLNFPSNTNSGIYSTTTISAPLVKNSSSVVPGQPRQRDQSRGRMYHLETLNNSSGEQPRHRGHSRGRMYHVENVGNGDYPLVSNSASEGQPRSREPSRIYHWTH